MKETAAVVEMWLFQSWTIFKIACFISYFLHIYFNLFILVQHLQGIAAFTELYLKMMNYSELVMLKSTEWFERHMKW